MLISRKVISNGYAVGFNKKKQASDLKLDKRVFLKSIYEHGIESIDFELIERFLEYVIPD